MSIMMMIGYILLISVSINGFQPMNAIIRRDSCKRDNLSFSSMKSLKHHKSLTIHSSPQDINTRETSLLSENPLKYGYISVWLLFTIFAFTLSPVDQDPDFTMNVIQDIIAHPYDGTINPIFVGIFNILGSSYLNIYL